MPEQYNSSFSYLSQQNQVFVTFSSQVSLERRPIPPFYNWEGRKRVWQHTASFSVPLPGESGANQIAERYINALVPQRSLAHYRSLFSSCLKCSYPATVKLLQAQQFSIADDDMILHLCWRRRAVNLTHHGYTFLLVAYTVLVDYSTPLTQKMVQCVARPFSAPPNYKMAEWLWVRHYSRVTVQGKKSGRLLVTYATMLLVSVLPSIGTSYYSQQEHISCTNTLHHPSIVK